MISATEPVKKLIKRTESRCVKQAHYREVDTGKRQVVELIGLDGKSSKEERAIVEKVFIPAMFEEYQYDAEVWVVSTQLPDGTFEDHEFATERDALRYREGV